ncbi:MAG: cytochrome c biogenesis protein ResB [Actinomycetota bacterium]
MPNSESPATAARSRPEGHIETPEPSTEQVTMPRLGPIGWARWGWRQLTSMRTALLLLLLLAVGAIPGSVLPQRTADPNGVIQYFKMNPVTAKVLDGFQAFDVYTSVWFSAIYLLLFVSLIGCVIPRTRHHWNALRQSPPHTPARLSRLPAYETHNVAAGEHASRSTLLAEAERLLRKSGYRVRRYDDPTTSGRSSSVSAEKGYLRETGNLIFHISLIGVLATILIGGSFQYTGQRVIVEGQAFVNTRAAYDSFSPGRLFTDGMLDPYSLTLDKFAVTYSQVGTKSMGMVTDYNATVTTARGSNKTQSTIKVNDPLSVGAETIYLLGNGYAPRITVRNAAGSVVFDDTIPFLPQDMNLTSLGVVKVPDGLPQQVGMIGFFYPTEAKQSNGQLASVHPDLVNPVLSLNVFTGDLGLDTGAPKSVYVLDTAKMTQVAGRGSPEKALRLTPGQTVQLPDGLGSVELANVKRFASFQVTHDPTQTWMFAFALLVLGGLATGLFVPRRRVWVRVTDDADDGWAIEYAGLARGDDPRLQSIVSNIAERHRIASIAATNREPQ